MESTGQRFSVISRTSDSETENRTPLTPYQPISVIKKPLKSWVKSIRRSKHPKHIIVLEGEPVTYKCTVCSTTFKSKSNCCYHKHCGDEGEKPFTCPICDRKFSTKTHFSYHTMMHSGLNPYKCSVCEKSFKTKYKLRRHQQVHIDTQKKFFCDVCGRAFLRESSIHVHKQVHTGVKPYQCNECPKAFREKKNLIFHLSHHTGIKNWVCEICGKSYALKRDLELHKRAHSRIRPFSCTVSQCHQTFSQRRYLKRHMETHESCVKFICNLCEKEFSRKDNLQRHIVNTHLESQNSNVPKAVKTKHNLLDTAPYIKSIKTRDAAETSHAVVPVEPQVVTARTESVIMSVTRTDGIVTVRSEREESSYNRISVIRTLADVSPRGSEANDSRELDSYDHGPYQPQFEPDNECRSSTKGKTSPYENRSTARPNGCIIYDEGIEIEDLYPRSFHAYENCEQNSGNLRQNNSSLEPICSNVNMESDKIHHVSYLRSQNCEQSYDEENGSGSRYNVHSEVSPRYVDLENLKTVPRFRNENEEYANDVIFRQSFDAANRSIDRCTSFESTVRVNQDQRLFSYCDRERFDDIVSEQRIRVHEVINNTEQIACTRGNDPEEWTMNIDCQSFGNISSACSVERYRYRENEESFRVYDDFSSNPSTRKEIPRVFPTPDNHEYQHYETDRRSEREREGHSPYPVYHNLTNCLSTDLYSSSRSGDEAVNTSQSSTNNDRISEHEVSVVASHFVPQFAPERITTETVKTRCMLPKKVIAASYRNCGAHETVKTRAGGLDTTTKDSYKLLDLSMKSQ